MAVDFEIINKINKHVQSLNVLSEKSGVQNNEGQAKHLGYVPKVSFAEIDKDLEALKGKPDPGVIARALEDLKLRWRS